jgi:molybdopterin-synthase adenylyltransferase
VCSSDLGVGTTLENRLLVYDGEYMEFHEIKIAPNPECTACKACQKS